MPESDFTLGPEAVAQLREMWRAWVAELKNPDAGPRRSQAVNESEKLQGFMAADLGAATDPRTGETTALLDVWYRDPASGDLLDAHRQVTVTNRSQSFSRTAGDYLCVFWVEDEWRPHRAGGEVVSFVLATLLTELCSDDPCVSVDCPVGACGESQPTKACNPLHRQGQFGDRALLARVHLCGPGYAEGGAAPGCPDLPCEQDGGGQLCAAARSGSYAWILLAVEPHPICVITEGGERRQDCIVLPKFNLPAEFCNRERCGDAVANVLDAGGDCDEVDLTFSDVEEEEQCCNKCCCDNMDGGNTLTLTFRAPGQDWLDGQTRQINQVQGGPTPGVPQEWGDSSGFGTHYQFDCGGTCFQITVHLECAISACGQYRMLVEDGGEALYRIVPTSQTRTVPQPLDCDPFHLEFEGFTAELEAGGGEFTFDIIVDE